MIPTEVLFQIPWGDENGEIPLHKSLSPAAQLGISQDDEAEITHLNLAVFGSDLVVEDPSGFSVCRKRKVLDRIEKPEEQIIYGFAWVEDRLITLIASSDQPHRQQLSAKNSSGQELWEIALPPLSKDLKARNLRTDPLTGKIYLQSQFGQETRLERIDPASGKLIESSTIGRSIKYIYPQDNTFYYTAYDQQQGQMVLFKQTEESAATHPSAQYLLRFPTVISSTRIYGHNERGTWSWMGLDGRTTGVIELQNLQLPAAITHLKDENGHLTGLQSPNTWQLSQSRLLLPVRGDQYFWVLAGELE